VWKKILVVVIILAVGGAGGFGTFHFYKENQNQIQQNQSLMQQNAMIQQQLTAIGDLTTVYEVATKVYSGKEIYAEDLVPVSVPVSTLDTSSITDMSQLVGRYYKVNIAPGTILSADMLMEEKNEGDKIYTKELTFDALPVSTVVGDYIDLRVILPTGEEYVVLSHEQIKRLYNTTITLFISEEENILLNSLFNDLAIYPNGCYAYLYKYIEPGKDTDTIAFYPAQERLTNFILFNPNVKDPTRCINETLRAHIDEVLVLYTDSENQSNASQFISTLKSQFTSQLAAQSMWVESLTDENGNFSVEGDPYVGGDVSTDTATTTESDQQSFETTVNESMDSIQENLDALVEEVDPEEIK
jgi:hypothetical protein